MVINKFEQTSEKIFYIKKTTAAPNSYFPTTSSVPFSSLYSNLNNFLFNKKKNARRICLFNENYERSSQRRDANW